MTRRFVGFSACLALGALLTACSGSPSTTGGSPGATPQLGGNAALPAVGSERPPMVVSPPSQVRIAVALPMRNMAELQARVKQISDPSSPNYRQFVSRAEMAQRYYPSTADLTSVAASLRNAGFSTRVGTQAVFASAAPGTVAGYLHTTLHGVQYASRTGLPAAQAVSDAPVTVPAPLAAVGAHVLGLEGLPPARTMSQMVRALPPGIKPESTSGIYGPYFPPDLKQAYRFPSYATVNGAGVTAAIVVDSTVSASDISAFGNAVLSNSIHYAVIPIDGGGGSDIEEATLDVEQSGGMAPGATIDVYDIPSLNLQDVYAAYDAALSNTNVTLVNSSFGLCEDDLQSPAGRQDLDAFDQVLAGGSAVGMTWVAASGDWSAFQCPDASQNQLGLIWPASDPNVLAVGGSDLLTVRTPGSYNSAYVAETAYDYPVSGGSFWGSGGGYSVLFTRPSWQSGFVSRNNRGVPDLSFHMGCCPAGGTQPRNSYYSSDWTYVNHTWEELIGTSAASPDIVGLLALRVEMQRKALGDVHAWLYGDVSRQTLMRRDLHGNNGYPWNYGYWDPVLGLGTPYGNTFAGTTSLAGIPGSSTNPGR